jgi:hypothetical protein
VSNDGSMSGFADGLFVDGRAAASGIGFCVLDA